MRAFIESRFQQFVHDLETIVNIDSVSGHGTGLHQVAAFFQSRFAALGWPTLCHEFNDDRVPCLEITNGVAPDRGERFDMLFMGHMDTVFPTGTATQRPFKIQGSHALGPGVSDMKGGLVTVLHAAETLQHFKIADQVSLCIAFNSDEEVGTLDSRQWLEGLAQRSRRVFVFEPSRAGGHRVIKRKGCADFEVICRGKAAHAGASPHKGSNAVVELAHQIIDIMAQSNPQLETTVNVTTANGGTATNVIPDFARADVDIRFSTTAEARRIEAYFQTLAPTGIIDGARVDVRGGIDRMPMVPSKDSLALWDQVAQIGERLGLEMKTISTGGVSDGNFTAALGIPTIDAMGPRGDNAHSEDEYLDLDSVAANILLTCELVKAAAEGKLKGKLGSE